jgi:hypothetical protein
MVFRPRESTPIVLQQFLKELSMSRAAQRLSYGEWWIDEGGDVMYADGDVGDMNHEMYVVDRLQRDFADDGFCGDEHVDWDGFKEHLYEEWLTQAAMNNSLVAPYARLSQPQSNPRALAAQIERDGGDPSVIARDLLKKRGMNDLQISIAENDNSADPRLYGIQYFGWKRVMNDHVETWDFGDRDRQAIVRGLGEIVPDDEEGESLWTIEVKSQRTTYWQVPLNELEVGNPMRLKPYARSY